MKHPPKLFLRFFRWFCHPKLLKYIEGDLMELYEERVERSGKFKADLKFIIDVIFLFRPGIIKPAEGSQNLNTCGMYKSYFKIGWRNLLRNKGYSSINIGGLTAGLTISILIGLWINDELSFNYYHANYSTIAQVFRKETRGDQSGTSMIQATGLGALLKTDYGSHFKRIIMMNSRQQERVIAAGDMKFTQIGYFMEPEGVELFSLEIIAGNGSKMGEINSILLSESLARKIFGEEDPINKIVSMNASVDLEVVGIYEDLPQNSEFQDASFFAPINLYTTALNVWDNYNVRVYVQLNQSSSAGEISAIIKHVTKSHIPEDRKQEIFLHPMSEWHLNTEFENGELVTSKKMITVWYYGIIGAFVLLLACINFMNLSTARSEHRAKEVGIRKTVGSRRGQLVLQFYSESLLVSLISFGSALLLAALTLPWFNTVADKDISIPWLSSFFWLAGLSFVFLTGALAGSYPALYLSSFRPVKVLKGRLKTGHFALSARKVLVVAQFTVSVALSIGTIVVYQQIEYAKDRPVGYLRENLIGLRTASPEFKRKYDVLRNELKATGMVKEIAEANYSITETLGWNGGFTWRNKNYEPSFNTIFVTAEYGKTIGWEFIEGRDFSRDFASDSSGIIINESALKILGMPNPVGEIIKWSNGDKNIGAYKILGVVKDMVKGSPYSPTDPSIIFHSRSDLPWLYIRLNPDANPSIALPKIATVFSRLVPSASFDFTFAEEAYEAKFKGEERIGKLAATFCILAILISCLGLFGLAAFSAEQRIKEIGIRKVLGASVTQLWKMLSMDFIMLVIIACVIALPTSFYFMNNWLHQYEYRVPLSWHVFALTTLGGLAVTLLTVSFQSVKAALSNPVNSLRSE